MKKSTIKILATFIFTLVLSSTSYAQQNNNERPKGPPSIKQIFKDLDTNKDDKISIKEAKGPLKNDFKKIDLNEDGFISKKELKKAPRPKKREQRRNK